MNKEREEGYIDENGYYLKNKREKEEEEDKWLDNLSENDMIDDQNIHQN